MGQFISFSIVKNNYQQETISQIRNYAASQGGGLEAADVTMYDENFCAVVFNGNKTVITYPGFFTEFLTTSALLSQVLHTTIYTFHIHDGDEWILYTFANGSMVSSFYPAQPKHTRNFDLQEFCSDLNLEVSDVERYFINWGRKIVGKPAYEGDQYLYGNCMQVFDLTLKMGVSYADVSNEGNRGACFTIWTKSLPMKSDDHATMVDIFKSKRYTKSYLRLTPDEIETIFLIDYNSFIAAISKRHRCEHCGAKDVDVADPEYYLAIDKLMVVTTGWCQSCWKKVGGGWGIQHLEALKAVLNK